MRLITITYTLRNGARGRLSFIGACTTDAITWAIGHFGPSLRTCAAHTARGRHA